ncbi:hypothetical protein HNQ07_004778 [Deinococcus metalli]|uniref:Uncharacterized protein n=1 Tax=Deinococcus metalli TaxID=1141878 RepID=A0A7W8NTL7_9DEIO|nr:hypothetical protein [Deinococcus metalli]MBB5379263.1 hypothetical protein [Deinococcus metalli]GHF66008.1 hypothetical protein GCM10017781_47170 [Deinococcus metalli]
MHRATQRYLGLPETWPTQDDQLLPIQTVKIQGRAQTHLLQALDIRGRWHGGALFGSHLSGTLEVPLITASAPPGTVSHPLTLSLPYLIGASQIVTTFLSAGVDWVGQWIAAPDGRLPDRRADLLWVNFGARRGLIDDRHPLAVIGLREGSLVGRAYIWDEGEPIEVDCPV